MDNPQIIRRGRITYYIGDTSVLVGIGGLQYISYNVYNSPVRSGLGEFKKQILNSDEDELRDVVELMDLARKCSLVGSGARKPDWLEK